MKTYSLRKNYRLIPDHIPYAINVYGDVYNCETNQNLECNVSETGESIICIDNNNNYDVRQLMLDTFIGHLDLPIILKPRRSVWRTVNDLTYDITDLTKISDDPLEYAISNTVFRKHPYYTDILVSEEGVILQYPKFYFIHVWQSPSHYPRIQRHSNSHKGYNRPISHLVYETWVGEIPDGMIIDHKDDIVYHNHWSNLQAITQRENIHRSYMTGGKSNRVFYPDETIHKICNLMAMGYSGKDIANTLDIEYTPNLLSLMTRLKHGDARVDITTQYNLDAYDPSLNLQSIPLLIQHQIIDDVKNGMRAKDLHQKYSNYGPQSIEAVYRKAGLQIYVYKLRPRQVEQIKERLDNGSTIQSICDEFEISKATVNAIRHNHYGKKI